MMSHESTLHHNALLQEHEAHCELHERVAVRTTLVSFLHKVAHQLDARVQSLDEIEVAVAEDDHQEVGEVICGSTVRTRTLLQLVLNDLERVTENLQRRKRILKF